MGRMTDISVISGLWDNGRFGMSRIQSSFQSFLIDFGTFCMRSEMRKAHPGWVQVTGWSLCRFTRGGGSHWRRAKKVLIQHWIFFMEVLHPDFIPSLPSRAKLLSPPDQLQAVWVCIIRYLSSPCLGPSTTPSMFVMLSAEIDFKSPL